MAVWLLAGVYFGLTPVAIVYPSVAVAAVWVRLSGALQPSSGEAVNRTNLRSSPVSRGRA